MTVKTRFAPSPTGKLHVGNIRAAIMTWLFTRANNGSFLLRLDDTDKERSKEEFAEAIQCDLTWLGLNWDEFARQRDRMARYTECIDKLKADGRLYPCYETPEELGLKRKSLLSRGLPPIYDRAALNLSDTDRAALEAKGLKPHWRFKLEIEPIEWNDLIRGPVAFHGKDMSDPVLIREDGSPLYHICSVIDDIDFGITHIVRGEDHVSNTASHLQMFDALGAKRPECAHLPLVSDAEGGKLSKRFGALSVEELRDVEMLEPMAILSYIGRLGTSQPIEPFTSTQPLIESFSFEKFSRNTPKFDNEELFRINAKILHETNFPDVKDRLKDMGMDAVDEAFWIAVRPNLERLRDIKEWWRVACGPVDSVVEDSDFISYAATLLPPAPWDENTWSVWTSAVKEKTGRKGKELFMPIRLALTGMAHGPELAVLLPLIGEERVKDRLAA